MTEPPSVGASAPEQVSASVWRLELPSRTLPPFTTTNTYLVVDGGVASIVDPGFDEPAMPLLRAALDTLGVRLVKAVLLTHTHADHRKSLQALLDEFEAPTTYVHPLELGRVNEAGVAALTDGRAITVGSALVTALHTPGHSPGHLCFHVAEEGTLLAGDLAAGSGSVWIGLPEGDVGAYLASIDRVLALPGLRKLGPGHGSIVERPYARLSELRAHRLRREEQVLEALDRPRSLGELRAAVYGDLDEGLRAPAEASLLAHLRKLMAEMRVVHLGTDTAGPFAVRR